MHMKSRETELLRMCASSNTATLTSSCIKSLIPPRSNQRFNHGTSTPCAATTAPPSPTPTPTPLQPTRHSLICFSVSSQQSPPYHRQAPALKKHPLVLNSPLFTLHR
jgi:hypothetical protein